MLEKVRLFFQKKGWKEFKKTDWAAIALTGVLLLVIAMPDSGQKVQKNSAVDENVEKETIKTTKQSDETYAQNLERRLETILGQMDGVGKVKVMITLADSGETILGKDVKTEKKSVTETDSDGGNRTTIEQKSEEETIYDETRPYVEKEILPKVEGVLVVAQGGANSAVVSNISDTVMALFKVDAHKIKVVKMSSEEE